MQRIVAERVALLVDVYGTDDFFGESAFVGSSETHEMAAALEATRLMTRSRSEVEELMPERPRLAIALLQLLRRRCRYRLGIDRRRQLVSKFMLSFKKVPDGPVSAPQV